MRNLRKLNIYRHIDEKMQEIRGHDHAQVKEFVDTITRANKFCNAIRARKEFNDTIYAGEYSEISEFLKVWYMIPE